eukprot:14397679-Alexandrium_andersonii.AAC.1
MTRAGISPIDWFRQAQDRKEWRKTTQRVYPLPKLPDGHVEWLDSWRPGAPLRQAGTRVGP